MAKRTGGSIRKARYKLRKVVRQRGKISPSRFLQKLSEGSRVALDIESGYHRGKFDLVYQGRTGVVIGTKGRCYEVRINDQGKDKTIIVHPVHLKRLQ